ncbi:MAG TPA: PEP/pyruvate-binding domain-containing protein [Candidatus Methylomirabilis sp.]|nr:PEP/pyruvate-binding domain-containing protein [Candidatus Methylomirabilis sp.]
MLTSSSLILPFNEIGIGDRLKVGGKGASLGEMSRAGFPVPAGCVVTTSAFDRFLAAIDECGEIRRSVERLPNDDLQRVTRTCAEVRARIEGAALPSDLGDAIVQHYHELCDRGGETPSQGPVAIRSSATNEDSAEASFAGLQDTYLWVRGREAVIEHVRKCWASLYNVESVIYRRRLKMPEQGLAIGVVIQRMVDSRCSGVMFTRSPVTGDRSVVVMEASWGLGAAIVSGEVTPDKYVVGKITGEIVSRTISSKVRQQRPNAAGAGVIHEDVPAAQQNIACLSDEEIRALLELARRVERHCGCPQDIEWAMGSDLPPGEKIFLLQSRPETVWAGKERAPVAAPKEKAFDHVVSLLGGSARKT